MANTYTQLYIHLVFAVKYRETLIDESFREELQKYITGIVQEYGHKMMAVYCMPDHCHIYLGYHPNQAISEIIRLIKSNTSKWINTEKKSKFRWQNGFGAFSYSKSQSNKVINYVRNQQQIHLKRSFKVEYIRMLEKFDIEYNENYLFEWMKNMAAA